MKFGSYSSSGLAQFPSTWGAPPFPPPRWALNSSISQGLSSFSTSSRPIWGASQPYNPDTQAPIPPMVPFVPPTPFRAPSPSLPPPPPPPIISTMTPPPPPPVIHQGVICDMCENTIEGVRHKCLDCPGMYSTAYLYGQNLTFFSRLRPLFVMHWIWLG